MSASLHPWLSFDDVAAQAANAFKDMSQHNVPRSVWLTWAGIANREFARRAEILRDTDLRPLIKSQELYRLRPDCIRVERVYVKIPGEGGFLYLDPDEEKDWFDSSSPAEGRPFCWYQTRDRERIGIRDVPVAGGFEGFTNGVGTVTTLTGPSSMSSTNDVYNGMVVRMLSGLRQGQEATITDYDGATRTLTFSPAFTGTPGDNQKFQIHPDSLRIEYIKAGNTYQVSPAGIAVQSTTPINVDGLYLNLPVSYRNDFWKGWELRFTSGTLRDHKARILTSRRDTTGGSGFVAVTFEESLPLVATATDTVELACVPNIPPAWHDALAEYCLWRAANRHEVKGASGYFDHFIELANEAKQTYRPHHYDRFQQINTDEIY